MKVNILLMKKIPGAKRVDWPEVPEWIWERAKRFRHSYVLERLDTNSSSVEVVSYSESSKSSTYRIRIPTSREVVAENITDGPWLIQEPDRLVPLTVEELQAKFPASDWLMVAIRGHDFWGVDFRGLMPTYNGRTGQATIIALNRHTFETVKIAEVVE